MRWMLILLVIVAALSGCAKQEEPAAEPAATPPSTDVPEGAKADSSGTGLKLNPNYKGN